MTLKELQKKVKDQLRDVSGEAGVFVEDQQGEIHELTSFELDHQYGILVVKFAEEVAEV